MKSWILEKEYRLPLLLAIWVLVFYGVSLGGLQFLRHTEADRTLIAWEMLEHGNLLVPTLLHSEILTKPPLYYWCTAFFLWVFGTEALFVTRLTSLFAGLFGVLFQYYFFLNITKNQVFSALVAFSLSTSILYFNLGTLAEIDMLFGVLTFISLSLMFLILEPISESSSKSYRIKLLIFCALSSALSFLTKGPPVIFFMIGACGTYFIWKFLSCPFSEALNFLKRSLIPIFSVFFLSVFIILLWLVPLTFEVGWAVLSERFQVEVFERVVSFSERGRGFHFYLVSLFTNGLPWTFFSLVGLFVFLFSKNTTNLIWTDRVFPELERNENLKKFFQYSLCVLISGFLMLSVAQGKSSRYTFSLIPFLLSISFLFSFQCLRVSIFKKLFSYIKLIFFLLFLSLLFTITLIELEGVSSFSYFLLLSLLILYSVVIIFSKPKFVWKNWFYYFCFFLILIRGVYSEVYIPHRNETKTVIPLAKSIYAELNNRPIYTIELFERWTVYYLKKMGLNAFRLTPSNLANFNSNSDTNINPEINNENDFLLLAIEEESWRYHQLKLFDNSTALIKVFPHSTSGAYLLKTSKSALEKLELSPVFPTYPSIPFHSELKQRNLIGK